MKKLSSYLIILLISSNSIQAQFNTYHTFPDSNAVWGMSSGCIDNMCGDWNYIKDSYSGDTVIGSFVYKKISEESLLMTSGSCCPPPITMGDGFLREDTMNKKIYWRSSTLSSDSLLYDFSLNVGDTLRGLLECASAHGPLTVVSIDSVIVGTSYRKRINFDTLDTCNYYSIIEGVGSTAGLTSCYYGHFEMGIGLRCFSVDGSILYSPSACGSADTIPCGILPTGTNELPGRSKLQILIYPNPSSDKIAIKSQEASLPFKIIIKDNLGRNLVAKIIDQSLSEIDLSNLKSGLYIIISEKEKEIISIDKLFKL